MPSHNQATPRRKICLLIVHPSPAKCDALISSLETTGSFARLLSSTSISAAKKSVAFHEIDVAVIARDLQEDEENSLSLVQHLGKLHRPVRSLVVADEWHRSDVVEAFRFGTKGLLTAHSLHPPQLAKAVCCVHQGQVWADSEQLHHVLDFMAASVSAEKPASGKARLSNREKEVAKLLVKGASNREISHALHISERTVKNHLARIFEKMGVNSRVQAALRLVA